MTNLIYPFELLQKDVTLFSDFKIKSKKFKTESFNSYVDALKRFKELTKLNENEFDFSLDAYCEKYGNITLHYIYKGKIKNYGFSN